MKLLKNINKYILYDYLSLYITEVLNEPSMNGFKHSCKIIKSLEILKNLLFSIPHSPPPLLSPSLLQPPTQFIH